MTSWTYYPVFVGSAVSAFTLTHLALTNRDKLQARTLSELATTERRLLSRFRSILLFCGILFAITMFAYILPRTAYSLPILVSSLAIIAGELSAGIVPAHNNTIKLHETLVGVMASGMLLLPYFLWPILDNPIAGIELALAVFMTVLAGLLLRDKERHRFVVYELSFIFSSHISIMLAAVAV